jgi:hypothetical protein
MEMKMRKIEEMFAWEIYTYTETYKTSTIG